MSCTDFSATIHDKREDHDLIPKSLVKQSNSNLDDIDLEPSDDSGVSSLDSTTPTSILDTTGDCSDVSFVRKRTTLPTSSKENSDSIPTLETALLPLVETQERLRLATPVSWLVVMA